MTCVVPLFSWAYSGIPLMLEWDWALALAPDEVDNLPLLIHVLSASVYYALAAVQMLPKVRRKYPGWHRRAGRIAVIAGIASAIACTWITFIHPDARGPILYYGRVVFGPLWTLCLFMGLITARRGLYHAHREWMIRAFAIAMPAGTLVFMIIPFVIFLDEIPVILEESIQSGAWVLHLGIAEFLIRKTRSKKHTSAKESTSNEFQAGMGGVARNGRHAHGVRIPEL
jgi:uncharacterized membrane protein